ncbi:MAG: fused MFS/spermidine synthase, partial [Verrucomicrobia bacterium]|nr:fused MFS/spermidine synthase [Verrucomicrobiota bacterium]
MKRPPVPSGPGSSPGLAASASPLSVGLRRYLYFTAAMTGAVIMIVEILGAKMLAPFVGTSHFVWTAQIAVTLVALAAGYYVGGRLVDRSLNLGKLFWAILGAAIYLGFTVLAVERVAYWCLDSFKLAVGSLVASAFLFFVPLALLAMTGPFLIRVLTVAVAGVGGNVGRLTAVSTLGSFAGTVLIGYVLIPFLPNSTTMFATAGVLMAVAAGYFFGWGRNQTSPAAVAVAMAIGLLAGGYGVAADRPFKSQNFEEVHRSNSNFGQLQVLTHVIQRGME